MPPELKINGEVYVLVPKAEYRRLTATARMPALPPLDADGTYPALAAMRVTIARTIIRRREAAGLSQRALAAAAGIRVETLNRLEKAKAAPNQTTIAAIDRALTAASSPKPRVRAS